MLSHTLPNPIAALTALLADTGSPFSFMYPEPASNHVDRIDWAFDFIHGVTIFFFVAIIAVMVWFCIRYRRKSPTDRAASQVSHSTALELGWTIPPVFVVLYMFWLGFTGFMNLRTVPENAYEIQVEAQRYGWTFTYPNGRTEQHLHVPAGRPVVLRMTSKDVIHSLYIPAFRVKQDVVPGRTTHVWFEARNPTPEADVAVPEDAAALEQIVRLSLRDEVEAEQAKVKDELAVARRNLAEAPSGTKLHQSHSDTVAKKQKAVDELPEIDAVVSERFGKLKDDEKIDRAERYLKQKAERQGHLLYCTEFCGTDHSNMWRQVVVHEPGWMPPDPDIEGMHPGLLLFQAKGCAACHQVEKGAPKLTCPTFADGIVGREEQVSEGVGGPTRTVTVDFDYWKRYIKDPMAEIVSGYPPAMPAIPVTDDEIKLSVFHGRIQDFFYGRC